MDRFWSNLFPERDSGERFQREILGRDSRERFWREIPERDSGEGENLWRGSWRTVRRTVEDPEDQRGSTTELQLEESWKAEEQS